MNKNIKLLLWLSLISWLSVLLFSENINRVSAALAAWYWYSCTNMYGYGNVCNSWYSFGYNGWSNVWWGTYNPTPLYLTTNSQTGSNVSNIMTSYGMVSKTVTATWTVIKLLDLGIYLDRTKQGQNEFGNIRKLKATKTEAMPKVGADMTDAYIFTVNLTQ